MEQFGPVEYAVLVNAAIKHVTQPQPDEKEAAKTGNKQDQLKKPDQLLGTHKGTGFVRFANTPDA